MSAIYTYGQWIDIVDRGTSGDQVMDILASWKVNAYKLLEDNHKLESRIAELEAENDRLQDGWFRDETICPDGSLRPKVSDLLNRIAELSQAVGLITTMKPTMVMDANHPLDMVREVAEHVTARIAELEAERRWIPVSEKPSKSDWYLIMYQGYGVPVTGYYHVDGGWLSDIPDYWMPLPEPPEVEK